jgi:hypothetical protein
VRAFIVIASFLVIGLLIGLIPQHTTVLLKAVVSEDNIVFIDLHNDVIGPLFINNNNLLYSEISGSSVCLVSPSGVRTFACVFHSGYLIIVEGQTWETTPEITTVNGVTISVSGIVTCNAMVYDTKERQDPHAEDQQKAVPFREPPVCFPPKRVMI